MPPFAPFTATDFSQVAHLVWGGAIPSPLRDKIDALRTELGGFKEFAPDYFRCRIARKENAKYAEGLVFGGPRVQDGHWFLYNVGGDQDQVQLNIGMYKDLIRVGLGFMLGRAARPKPPAFTVLQQLLSARPALPFRQILTDLLQRRADFGIACPDGFLTRSTGYRAQDLVQWLETHVPPANETTFILVGALWDPAQASTKHVEDYREVFCSLMPVYEALIILSARCVFIPPP